MTEKDIQNEILQYLLDSKTGSFDMVYNLPPFDFRSGQYRRPSKHYRKGVCDIVGCLEGRFIGIEVKTPREFTWVKNFYKRIVSIVDSYNPLTKKEAHVLNQIRYIRNKNSNGGYCFFTYSLGHTQNMLDIIKPKME